jgi:hypothetical protein
MRIKTGSVSNSGGFCIVLEDPRDRLSDSVLYLNDGAENWQRFDPGDLIEAVCFVPAGFGTKGDFIAVTGEGVVFDVVGGLPSSQIVGAGYENPGALKRGLLAFAELVDGVPMAMGFGGQVYVMQPDDDVKFVSGAKTAKQGIFYFVGSIITETPDSEPIDAANDSGDADALVAALLDQTRQDSGCVFTYDGRRWRQLNIPTNDAVDEVESVESGVAYVRLREGTLVALPSTDEWEVLYDDPLPISGECRFGEDIVFAAGEALYRVVDRTIEPFDPPMPEGPGYIVEVCAANRFLAVIRSEAVLMFDGIVWSQSNPPAQ